MQNSGSPPIDGLPSYLVGYVKKARGEELFAAFANASEHAERVAGLIPSEMDGHRYAPGKWSIKEVVQHVNDAERVFAYRALRFARNDATPLPAFEENHYARTSEADQRMLLDLWEEHRAIRRSTLQLFSSFTLPMLQRSGMAGGNAINVLSLGWVIAGHAEHHWEIIRERYL